jgi:glucosamine-6-phosphate deaminase
MQILVKNSAKETGEAAAAEGIKILKEILKRKGSAAIILATGASQFDMLAALTASRDIDWSRITMFHLDEYIHLPETHPASFRKYLKERFLNKVPALKEVYLINGDDKDPEKECARLNQIISRHPVDIAFVGIGENGHLAFNDPPADFETDKPYIVVELDLNCRKQQMGEGWFPTVDDVPGQAISMSIRQIMKSEHIICTVPDKRKAQAVADCLEGIVSNVHPASILQQHANCSVYLDRESASLLKRES